MLSLPLFLLRVQDISGVVIQPLSLGAVQITKIWKHNTCRLYRTYNKRCFSKPGLGHNQIFSFKLQSDLMEYAASLLQSTERTIAGFVPSGVRDSYLISELG